MERSSEWDVVLERCAVRRSAHQSSVLWRKVTEVEKSHPNLAMVTRDVATAWMRERIAGSGEEKVIAEMAQMLAVWTSRYDPELAGRFRSKLEEHTLSLLGSSQRRLYVLQDTAVLGARYLRHTHSDRDAELAVLRCTVAQYDGRIALEGPNVVVLDLVEDTMLSSRVATALLEPTDTPVVVETALRLHEPKDQRSRLYVLERALAAARLL